MEGDTLIKYTQVQFIDENDKVIDEFTYAHQPIDPEVREELKDKVVVHYIAHLRSRSIIL